MNKAELKPETKVIIQKLLTSREGKIKVAASLVNPLRYQVDYLRNDEDVKYRFKGVHEISRDRVEDRVLIESERFYCDDDLKEIAILLLQRMKKEIEDRGSDEQFVVDDISVIPAEGGVTIESVKFLAFITGWWS